MEDMFAADSNLGIEREINELRRTELEALQLKLNYYLKKVKNINDNNYEENLSNYECAKKNLQSFYQERARIILYQNRAEIFDMSDATKLYHFQNLNNYIKSSWINKIEVDGQVHRRISRNSLDGNFNL